MKNIFIVNPVAGGRERYSHDSRNVPPDNPPAMARGIGKA